MKNAKKLACLLCVILFTVTVYQTPNVKAATSEEGTYVASQTELIQVIHDNLVSWNSNFTISYKGAYDKILTCDLGTLFNKVFLINDTSISDDYDYMKGTVKKYSVSITSNSSLSTFTFNITYRETKAQHTSLNKLVKSALSSMNLSGKSDYTKIKKIHDYIVNRVTYDSGGTLYTAYAAGIKKKAVCQGYALLFYKMATDAGLSVRCVASSTHEWNIVKLGRKWYVLDTTWDDPVSSKPVLRYTYFLKGSSSVTDSTHKMLSEYTTASFKKNFPISTKNYSS